MKFKREDKLMHILSKDFVIVMEAYENKGRETVYNCRTKNHDLVNFFEWELTTIGR